MKRLVNGVEMEVALGQEGAEIVQLPDRLLVKTCAGAHSAIAVRDGDATLVSYLGRQFTITKATSARAAASARTGEMKAPMPGQIADVLVREGQEVKKGERLLVLEAMKVQQPYLAPFDGVVAKLAVAKGQQVSEGALLALVEPARETAQ